MGGRAMRRIGHAVGQTLLVVIGGPIYFAVWLGVALALSAAVSLMFATLSWILERIAS
jgi:hypothetical protein